VHRQVKLHLKEFRRNDRARMWHFTSPHRTRHTRFQAGAKPPQWTSDTLLVHESVIPHLALGNPQRAAAYPSKRPLDACENAVRADLPIVFCLAPYH
jgi:hypothetical protein